MLSRRSFLPLAVGFCAVVLTTTLVIAQPLVFAFALVATMVVGLFLKPVGRLVVFAGGVMAIFQSTSLGTAPRIAFVALVLLGVVPAAISGLREARRRGIDLLPFVLPLVLLMVLILLSLVRLMFSGVALEAWFRDATTYLLIAVAPVYGIDAALHSKQRSLQAITLVVGVVGAFAFMVAWLSRRGYAIAGLDQFAIASSLLAVPGITLCLTLYFTGSSRRWIWAVGALVQAGMLVGAGGRSAVIYLVALFVFFVVSGARIGTGATRSVWLLVVAFVSGFGILAVAAALGLDRFLISRYDWFGEISLGAVQSDASGILRLRAYDTMWNAFLESPILGNGFGVSYANVYTGRVLEGTFTLDTPLVYLAKFGVIGTALFVMAIALLARAIIGSSLKGSEGRKRIQLFVGGLLVVWVAVLPSGAPSEQKGFAVSLALMVAVGAGWGWSERASSVQRPARSELSIENEVTR